MLVVQRKGLRMQSRWESSQRPGDYPTELQKNFRLSRSKNWRVGLERSRVGPCGDRSLTVQGFKTGEAGKQTKATRT